MLDVREGPIILADDLKPKTLLAFQLEDGHDITFIDCACCDREKPFTVSLVLSRKQVSREFLRARNKLVLGRKYRLHRLPSHSSFGGIRDHIESALLKALNDLSAKVLPKVRIEVDRRIGEDDVHALLVWKRNIM